MKKLFMGLAVLILGLTLSSSLWASGTQPSGSGTTGDPYLVSTLDHLLWISSNSSSWGSNFKQTANIDATDTQNWDGGLGFMAIGAYSNKFTGTYNGQGYTIDQLYIHRTGWGDMGFFGCINGATLQNLGLTNVIVWGYQDVGGLVGECTSSNLSNCYSTGNVYASHSSVGGLVGSMASSTVSTCYSSCDVDGNEHYVGGLSGYNSENTISNCYSTGSVDGAGYYVGGLVGALFSSCTVSNCYTTSEVEGTAYYVGGLAGALYSSCTVSNCYSTGHIAYYYNISIGHIGGLVGYNSGSTVNDAFWDTQTSGLSSSDGGTGKTTAEMKDCTTFTAAGWDFVSETTNGTNDYWDADQSGTVNNGYMLLSWQSGVDSSLPVELESFTATVNEGIVILTWITGSELENLGFILERVSAGSTTKTGSVSSEGSTPTGWIQIASFETDSGLEGHGSSNTRSQYSFTDKSVVPNKTYNYRLADVSYAGEIVYHEMTLVGVMVEKIPDGFALLQNFPNPFNPSTTIRYELSQACDVTITIYNLQGQQVYTFTEASQTAGYYSQQWHGLDNNGNQLASGVYFIIVSAPEFRAVKKMILNR